MGSFSSIDPTVAALASRQGGYVHSRQLVALGLTSQAIAHRVKRGSLARAYRHVYAVGHVPTHPLDRARGALLASGPRSALTHQSAGSFHGVYKTWRYPLHIVVPTDRRLSGVVIHRNRRLTNSDIWTPQPGLRVTSPALTLLDLSPMLADRRRRRLFNELRLKHSIPLEAFRQLLKRMPRHPGARHLKAILNDSQREPTRSGWEDEWMAFARRYELPPHVMNRIICGARADVYFPSEGVIVELDGWESHQTHEAFVADRERDVRILAETGIPTVRMTYERFHRQPLAEARRLHAILKRRRGEGHSPVSLAATA